MQIVKNFTIDGEKFCISPFDIYDFFEVKDILVTVINNKITSENLKKLLSYQNIKKIHDKEGYVHPLPLSQADINNLFQKNPLNISMLVDEIIDYVAGCYPEKENLSDTEKKSV